MFKKFLFGLLVLATVQTFSQETFVAAGSKSVLFSFSGLSDLGAGDFAGGAGVKYFLNSQSALRVGLQLTQASTTTPANPPTGGVGADGSSSKFGFGLSAALEYHLSAKRVSPYLGGGISFSTSSDENKGLFSGPSGSPIVQTTTKNASGNTTFSIFGLFGAEYFIADAVSLAAEYQLGYGMTSAKDKEVSTPGYPTVTTKGESKGSISLNSAGTLTLAIYF